MVAALRLGGIENVAEKLPTQLLQQVFLRFKVGVKGGSTHIGLVDDLPDGDLGEILLLKQLGKGCEDGFPCFSLASVHSYLHTFFRICSVSYRIAELAVAKVV